MRVPLARISASAAVAFLAAGLPGTADAGGFQVTEVCAQCQGQRNAGMAAATGSAAAGAFNPAAEGRVEGAGLDVGLHALFGQFKFRDEGSTNAFGRPQQGSRRADGAEDAYLPNLHLAGRLGEHVGAGLHVTVPYGLATDYGDRWTGRYHAVRSELVLLNVNLNLAWNLTPRLSVGAGAAWQEVDAEIGNAVDFGAVARVLIPGLSPVPVPPELLPDSGDPAYDGHSRLDGSDDAWGWTAGVLYDGERTRLGLGWRSAIDHEVAGRVTVSVPGALQDALGAARLVTPGTADVSTPSSATLGVQHDLDDRWTLLAGATWTDWSVFDALVVVDQDGNVVTSQPEDWEDSWRYSAGFEYRYDPDLTLRMGLEFDETPVPAGRLTARIPDEDRYLLAVGATWRVTGAVRVDFAWTHVWVPGYDIEEQEFGTGAILEDITGTNPGIANTLVGAYDAEAEILSLGVRVAW